MRSRMIDFFKILINLGTSRMIVRMTVAAEERLLFNGNRGHLYKKPSTAGDS